MIDLERLLRVPYVDVESGLDISSDGEKLAFSWNLSGQWELYQLPLHGTNADPRLVSVGQGAKFAPTFSPNAAHLAYLVDFDGSENYHIFIQPLDDPQKAVDLMPEVDFAIQPNFCWSPDGREIAFLADKTGCFGAYLISLEGGESRLLFENGMPAWDVKFSPDGQSLAVMCEAEGQDYALFVVPIEGSPAHQLADARGGLNAHDPVWSPDGAQIAFHSDVSNGFQQIGIYEVASQKITWLTAGEANSHSAQWSHDGRKLAFVRARGASDEIVVRRLDGGEETFKVAMGVHYKAHFTPDDGTLIFAFNSPALPPDLWLADLKRGKMRQLTHSLPAELAETAFVLPQEIVYAGMDGMPVPALLFKSDAVDERTPAVVFIHGGPNWHYQMEWFPMMAHLASRGWTVLAPNYRGSTGYGRAWQYANRYDMGGVDTNDVAAGAQYLIAEKLADPERIVVTGRSHGGYLTMSCLTTYPDLWRCGSAVVPFLNWFTGHENSRDDLKHWDIENFGDPKENYDLWYERSPFFFLDRVNAPVQLICGENDPRCPASESIQARDKLLEYGTEVDFALYEGEGHSFLKIENVVDALLRQVKFLAKNLA